MDTLASSSVRRPAFHSDDLEPLGEYRTLSSLAIVSLLFGLAAPLCFVTPLLMAIPLFGAALSIVALRRIAASDGALAGRWAAATGLALSVASAGAAISHMQLTRYLRSQQAEQFGRAWIELLLAGDTDQAFQRTLDGARPAPPPEPGGPAPEETPREHFGHQPLVEALAGAGTASDIRFDGTIFYARQPPNQLSVGQRFTITPHAPAAAIGELISGPVEVILTMQRSRLPGEPASRWLVVRHEAPGLPAAETHNQ